MFNINPIKKKKEDLFFDDKKINLYHLAKLITRIDETKLIENITVDQRHDLTTRLFAGGCWEDPFDDIVALLINKLADDVEWISIGIFVLSDSWLFFAGCE